MSLFSYFFVTFALLSGRPPKVTFSLLFVTLNFSGFRALWDLLPLTNLWALWDIGQVSWGHPAIPWVFGSFYGIFSYVPYLLPVVVSWLRGTTNHAQSIATCFRYKIFRPTFSEIANPKVWKQTLRPVIPQSEVVATFLEETGETCGEHLAKHFADFRPSIYREMGAKKFTKNPRHFPQCAK